MLMKQILLTLKAAMTTSLLALPLCLMGQDLPSSTGLEDVYFYSTSFSSGNIYNQGPVGKVMLSAVPDEFVIMKKTDVTQQKIENAVLNLIPTAQISWVKNDICAVIADEQALEANRNELLSMDDIVSLRPAYIRTVYKDLINLYPVKQVALYCFHDLIPVVIKENSVDKAEELIASMGLQAEIPNESDPLQRLIYVSKESDIIGIANRLYESGYFDASRPRSYNTVRTLDTEPLDKSGLDYYYDDKGNKNYLYKSPGRFMIKKDNATDKSIIETIIDKYLDEPSVVWKTDNLCKVETEESLVDEAINKVRTEGAVVSVNRSFMFLSEYENTLVEGTNYPADKNFDESVIVMFKDGLSDYSKDSLMSAYGLTLVDDQVFYSSWAAPKTSDILQICNSIYESGLVKYVEPNWVSGFQIIYHSGGTTDIVKPHAAATKTSENYYDLLGRRLDSPSGLTIVVTRYSDGSVRTEKKLFKN